MDYHRDHAHLNQAILAVPFSWEVLQHPGKRWWNAYWAMYDYLLRCDFKGKKVLVLGCGFGDDALRLAKLGAQVSAFDLSPECLQIARALALREGLDIAFDLMPAEKMLYAGNTFDYIISRDILHHVDIEMTMDEIVRVGKPGAIIVVNEIYSHSFTDRIRWSWFVEKFVYPRMRRFIYGPGKPYITEDEKKINEHDLKKITGMLNSAFFKKYFNCFVTRVVPDRFKTAAQVDRALLRILHPFGHFLAGRVLFAAQIRKPADSSGH